MTDSVIQPRVFFCCIVLGAVVYFAYKLTHAKRCKNIFLLSLQDVVFCIIAFALLWRGLLFVNCGQIRWYCVVGILLGYLLALKTVGVCVDNLCAKLYNFFIKQKESKKDG
ncbi:MAG: spore cortex biosynthesis protein YabQ [Clostridia bacterium]|nr:spore cortex biosynthesis protein YabQ [Clostridia bacterium]